MQDLSRVHQYVECIKRSGAGWIGLRFKFPLVWIPTYQYYHPYPPSDKIRETELVLSRGYKDRGEDIVDFTRLHSMHVKN